MGTKPDTKDNPYKGAEFLAEIKRMLYLERFVTAVPEPDVGEDLWAVDVRDGENDEPLEIARLFQCQVKSAHKSVKEGGKKRIQKIVHTVNFEVDPKAWTVFGLG